MTFLAAVRLTPKFRLSTVKWVDTFLNRQPWKRNKVWEGMRRRRWDRRLAFEYVDF